MAYQDYTLQASCLKDPSVKGLPATIRARSIDEAKRKACKVYNLCFQPSQHVEIDGPDARIEWTWEHGFVTTSN